MAITIGDLHPYKSMRNIPVIVGVGTVQQKGNFDELDEALVLMDLAFKKSLDDTTNHEIKNYID